MADFGGDLDAFRIEVRDFLKASYPPELKDPAAADPEAMWGGRAFAGSNDPQIVWMKRVAARGWTAPTWPKQYGGGGLTPDQARIVEQELAHYRPPLVSFGIWMLGPVLLEFANEAQKAEQLPKIIQGEIRWCQGYSEPGAGSDLASLQTRCEDKGDHWLINGQKVWTSYANFADWCFCLVRTDPAAKKHEGISFVLIDMASPGVETRPIKLISGESPFCETFFTDVKSPRRTWSAGSTAAGRSPSGSCNTSGRTSPAASARAAASVARPATWSASPSGMTGSTKRARWPITTCAAASPATRWTFSPSA